MSGYEVVEFDEAADVYIVNTCTVTAIADKKSRQMIRRAKTKNPNAQLIVMGCYAEVAKDELKKIKEIDVILSQSEKNKILEYTKAQHIESTRAMIKIEDGCNNFCSYCMIPYARGRVKSRKKDEIIDEIKKLVDLQVKEVVITGIEIASWEEEQLRLIDLLEEINRVSGLERIRLGSFIPTVITEEFAERLSKLDKICNQFHLSLQSGCDTVLKRMNRKYTVEEFREKVQLLRKYFQNANLTTDVIVGFPGETEEEFSSTYEFLKEIEFYKMHIFKYAIRPGTVAAKMENQVDAHLKEQRSRILIALSNSNEKKIQEQYIGKELAVLFEEEKNGYAKGHTKNYMMVNVKTNNDIRNKIRNIHITKTSGNELIGVFFGKD